jgi:arsenate reductase
MAQALTAHFAGDRNEAFSAGTHPTSVRPETKTVLEELGIDTSNLRSKPLADFWGEEFDLVVTVCDNAKEICPFFPGAKKRVHMGFPDPNTEDEFRVVRDLIHEWVRTTIDER